MVEITVIGFTQIGYIASEFKGLCFFDKYVLWKDFKTEILK
jgi:hypothetical protein